MALIKKFGGREKWAWFLLGVAVKACRDLATLHIIQSPNF
jgi:hypothetical protein